MRPFGTLSLLVCFQDGVEQSAGVVDLPTATLARKIQASNLAR